MAVSIEERLRLAECFNEPLPAESVTEVKVLIEEQRREIEQLACELAGKD